jgi:PAS domain S-box-containing protein
MRIMKNLAITLSSSGIAWIIGSTFRGSHATFLMLFLIPVAISARVGGFWYGALCTLIAVTVNSFYTTVSPLQSLLFIKQDGLVFVSFTAGALYLAWQISWGHAERRKFQTAFRASPDGMVITRFADGRILDVNDVMVALSGLPPEQIVGKTTTEIGAWSVPEQRNEFISALQKAGSVRDFDIVMWAPGGTRLGSLSSELIELNQELCVLSVFNDLTEKRQAELERERLLRDRHEAQQALAASEHRYRELVENANDLIFTQTLDGRLLAANKATELVTGYALRELLSMTMRQLVAPESIPEMEARLAEANATGRTRMELEIFAKGGRRVVLDINARVISQEGKPYAINGIARDVTEQRRLQEQLNQSQKSEAIGQLAGGVAHDFNNLLNVINGYAELAQMKTAEPERVKYYLQQILASGQRAADLTFQLLAFSRKQVLVARVLNLSSTIEDIARLFHRLIGEDIRLVLRLNPALWPVKGDKNQVETVIMNLVVNARDAMPRGGVLTVSTANCEQVELPGLTRGDFVRMTVSDTGIGMSLEVQARIFEPFFTTKETGKGTGLGLATVYGIVKQSGGNIFVHSAEGEGTTFEIYLPRYQKSEAPPPKSESEETGVMRARVLVVEDEERVRTAIREMLQTSGMSVTDACDGDSALKASATQEFDVILMDVVMPGANGRQVAEQIVARMPGAKVLFMSGYTDDATLRYGVEHAKVAFLPKPFSRTSLVQAIRKLLEKGNTVSG